MSEKCRDLEAKYSTAHENELVLREQIRERDIRLETDLKKFKAETRIFHAKNGIFLKKRESLKKRQRNCGNGLRWQRKIV
eukprot:TRINITY_DN3685_c0_g1_i2.p3 TRINITY_DN3685_c0_g1~~TRINITY_DN3685_c0_g1_i2.p3  ORF type:complete len:94 (+),score=22.36 TRINITY_DN3685_c0_g1_i2:45-284(+)